MKYAICARPYGRPGAMLSPMADVPKDMETIARLFMRPKSEVTTMFEQSGFNAFHPKWKKYIKNVHKINSLLNNGGINDKLHRPTK
jgi:hypothetical protein